MKTRRIYKVEEIYYSFGSNKEIITDYVTEKEYFEDKQLAEDFYNRFCNEIKETRDMLKGVMMDETETHISISDLKDPYKNDMIDEVNDIEWDWVKEFSL